MAWRNVKHKVVCIKTSFTPTKGLRSKRQFLISQFSAVPWPFWLSWRRLSREQVNTVFKTLNSHHRDFSPPIQIHISVYTTWPYSSSLLFVSLKCFYRCEWSTEMTIQLKSKKLLSLLEIQQNISFAGALHDRKTSKLDGKPAEGESKTKQKKTVFQWLSDFGRSPCMFTFLCVKNWVIL